MSLIPTIHAAECTTIGCGLPTSNPIVASGGIQWSTLVSKLVAGFFFLAALACLAYLLWGGMTMITSSGDSGKFDTGRNRIVFAVIGMIVVASSYAIWLLILNIIGFESFDTGFF